MNQFQKFTYGNNMKLPLALPKQDTQSSKIINKTVHQEKNKSFDQNGKTVRSFQFIDANFNNFENSSKTNSEIKPSPRFELKMSTKEEDKTNKKIDNYLTPQKIRSFQDSSNNSGHIYFTPNEKYIFSHKNSGNEEKINLIEQNISINHDNSKKISFLNSNNDFFSRRNSIPVELFSKRNNERGVNHDKNQYSYGNVEKLEKSVDNKNNLGKKNINIYDSLKFEDIKKKNEDPNRRLINSINLRDSVMTPRNNNKIEYNFYSQKNSLLTKNNELNNDFKIPGKNKKEEGKIEINNNSKEKNNPLKFTFRPSLTKKEDNLNSNLNSSNYTMEKNNNNLNINDNRNDKIQKNFYNEYNLKKNESQLNPLQTKFNCSKVKTKEDNNHYFNNNFDFKNENPNFSFKNVFVKKTEHPHKTQKIDNNQNSKVIINKNIQLLDKINKMIPPPIIAPKHDDFLTSVKIEEKNNYFETNNNEVIFIDKNYEKVKFYLHLTNQTILLFTSDKKKNTYQHMESIVDFNHDLKPSLYHAIEKEEKLKPQINVKTETPVRNILCFNFEESLKKKP